MNEYISCGEYIVLRITRRNGDVYDFPIDNEDVGMVQAYGRWSVLVKENKPWYVYAKCRGQLLHRLVMGNPTDMEVDHKDRDTKNNRKYNLRSVTHIVNMNNRSRHMKPNGTVYYDKSRGKWRGKVKYMGKIRWAGQHNTEEEARVALDALIQGLE